MANILGLIMINKNEQLPAKPIISIRLQLQVNTCHTFGAVLVCIRRWYTLLGGFIQADIQWNCNFSTAISFAIDSPTLIDLKHLTAVSSRWPRGPLVMRYIIVEPTAVHGNVTITHKMLVSKYLSILLYNSVLI